MTGQCASVLETLHQKLEEEEAKREALEAEYAVAALAA